MSNPVLERYESCNKIVRALLRYSPIWSETTLQRSVKTFLTCYASFISMILGYAILAKASRASNMTTLTELLVPGVALVTNPFKLMPTLIYKDAFLEMYQELDSDMQYYCEDTATMKVEKTTLKIFGASMKFLSLCYKMLLFNYGIVPLIFILYQIVTNIRPVTLILPCPASYPECFMNNIFIFLTVYILEITAMGMSASISLGADCFFGLVVFQMTAIMNALSNKVLLANANDDLFSILRVCIDKHCQFIKYSHMLEPIYGLMVLSQRLTDAIVLCAVIYQMNGLADLNMSQWIMYPSWVMLKFMQQLTYGWYGSLLTTESENFMNKIYFCKWPAFYNKKIMTYIVHVLQQKPIAVNVFGFFVISIPMASSVITASFSYFFLLQSLEQAQ